MNVLEKIPFKEINSIPQLIKDFLNYKIEDFKEHTWSLENIESQINRKALSYTVQSRNILLEELGRQHSGIQLEIMQKENLNLLSKENTFTITTGHQLNLFTGPVFFIYKILQTIKTAQFLNEKFDNQHFVPVFWMATEDHDFDEINHFKTKDFFYEIHEKFGMPVGEIEISDVHFIRKFEEEFKDFTFGTELVLMMKEAYGKGKTLAEATRILVNRLFSKYGLLILDGNCKALKTQMISTFRDELENHSLKEKSREKVEALTEKYGKVQVNPRDINLFFIDEDRLRIDEMNGTYHFVDSGKKMEKSEILKALEKSPEKFSPNALMRPVYQETVLPNIAYVGGNAEVMYWLELKDYFEYLDLPFPVLIPRNSMLFLSKKSVSKANKLNLNTKDFFRNFASITNDKILENQSIQGSLSLLREKLQLQFEELHRQAETTDKSFGNMVNAEETRQTKSFERFEKRLLRAEKIKQKELLERLENLFLEVHPGKNWQERVFNFSEFYKDEGKAWLDTCLREIDVQVSELVIVEN